MATKVLIFVMAAYSMQLAQGGSWFKPMGFMGPMGGPPAFLGPSIGPPAGIPMGPPKGSPGELQMQTLQLKFKLLSSMLTARTQLKATVTKVNADIEVAKIAIDKRLEFLQATVDQAQAQAQTSGADISECVATYNWDLENIKLIVAEFDSAETKSAAVEDDITALNTIVKGTSKLTLKCRSQQLSAPAAQPVDAGECVTNEIEATDQESQYLIQGINYGIANLASLAETTKTQVELLIDNATDEFNTCVGA